MNQYLCRGEKGYWAALLNYGQSTTTLFQFSIWAFFSYSSFFYFFLFAFNLFCLAMRFIFILQILLIYFGFYSISLFLSFSHLIPLSFFFI